MKRLAVAIMGLEGAGQRYRTAVDADEQFELVAIADEDQEVIRRSPGAAEVRTYRDYRSLIVETARTGLDGLFVALGPYKSIEFVGLAAKHGVAVFHSAPFARNVREARQVINHFARGQRLFVVSRPWQFDPALSRLSPVDRLAGVVRAVTVRVFAPGEVTGRRGDMAYAGGGVMLYDAYEAVDLVVHLLGVPETVFALCGAGISLPETPQHDTEDVAILSLRFADGAVGCVSALRGMVPPGWEVTLFGERATVVVSPGAMHVKPHQEDHEDTAAAGADEGIRSAVSAFGAACRSDDVARVASTAEQHLSTLAVIEAGYLSAKTGGAESPNRLLE